MNKITFDDLKNYKGFDEIDKKVKFIEDNRHICEYVIRELNKNIDLDYVKQSEFIEYSSVGELNDLKIDETTKILRAEPELPFDDLLKEKDLEKYYDEMNKQYDNSTLVLMRDKGNGEFETDKCKSPKHLVALGFALRQARKERRQIQNGENPYLDSDFIEEINAQLLSDLMPNGPTAGYGRYRRVVYRYGSIQELNVRVSDAAFETTPAQDVDSEMQALVEEYNKSDLHPILKAIVFKTKFIKIHPFCDFNGRTSRILLNYMLVRYGYPTVTIKGSQKERYLEAMDAAIVKDDYSLMIALIKKLLNKRCDKYISIIQEHMQKDAEHKIDV